MASSPGRVAQRVSVLLLVLAVGMGAAFGCQPAAAPPAATQAPAAPTKAPQTQASAATPTQAAAPATTQAPATKAPATTPAAGAAQMETLKVGVAAVMSGPAAIYGLNIQRYMQMSMDDISARGGVKVGGKAYRLEAIQGDDKNLPEAGRETANKLALSDKVKIILGGSGSAIPGMQVVTEPNKVLLLGSSGVETALGPKFPLTFNMGSGTSEARVTALLDWLIKANPNAKRVAIAQPDLPLGRLNDAFLGTLAPAKGLTVIAREFYPPDSKDLAPLATRLMREKPEVVVSDAGSTPAQFVSLAQALAEQGYKGLAITVNGTKDAIVQAGKFIPGNVTYASVDPYSLTISEMQRQVLKRYVDKWGEAELDVTSSQTYNIAWVVAQAMEKAGTIDDTEKLAKTLREGEWETIWTKEMGKSKFGGTKTVGLASIMDVGLYLSKEENGKAVTFQQVPVRVP